METNVTTKEVSKGVNSARGQDLGVITKLHEANMVDVAKFRTSMSTVVPTSS